MDEAQRRVDAAARDARSVDDGVPDYTMEELIEGEKLDSPLDKETLGEQASTQMGEMWEVDRRYDDE